jgi:hypothetical protein
MAKLTKYTQCERFEERRSAITATRDKALEDFPRNVHAAFTKDLNDAILKLSTEAAEMAVKNGFLSAEELAAAKKSAETSAPAPPAEPAQPEGEVDQSVARAKPR